MSRNNKDRKWHTSNTLRKEQFAKRGTYSTTHHDVQATLRSLQAGFLARGNGNLYDVVAIPEEMKKNLVKEYIEFDGLSQKDAEAKAETEAINEWMAENTVDFLGEVELLYGLVQAYHNTTFPGKGQGFPNGFVYTFPEKTVYNAPAYCDEVFGWVNKILSDHNIFPQTADEKYPVDFISTHVKKIFTRLFRVLAIMYAKCLPSLIEITAVESLNTGFKHFFYYVKRYNLLDNKEYECLRTKAVRQHMDLKQYEIAYEQDRSKATTATKKKKK